MDSICSHRNSALWQVPISQMCNNNPQQVNVTKHLEQPLPEPSIQFAYEFKTEHDLWFICMYCQGKIHPWRLSLFLILFYSVYCCCFLIFFNCSCCCWVLIPAPVSSDRLVCWQNNRIDLHIFSLTLKSLSPWAHFDVFFGTKLPPS